MRWGIGETRKTGVTRRYGKSAAALCAAFVAGSLLLAGCAGVEPDQHGAGEKLTESGGQGGEGPSASDSRAGSKDQRGSADGDADSSTDSDSGSAANDSGGDLVGGRLPEVELGWLRPARDAGEFANAEAGERVSLDELTGQPLVINIWATWCTPCRDEIPHFQRLSEQAGNRLRVLGVDHADQEKAAGDLLDELKVDYPQVADPDAELKAPFRLGIGLPVTVYVSRDGKVEHVARTPYQTIDQLRSDVERHLDVSL